MNMSSSWVHPRNSARLSDWLLPDVDKYDGGSLRQAGGRRASYRSAGTGDNGVVHGQFQHVSYADSQEFLMTGPSTIIAPRSSIVNNEGVDPAARWLQTGRELSHGRGRGAQSPEQHSPLIRGLADGIATCPGCFPSLWASVQATQRSW